MDACFNTSHVTLYREHPVCSMVRVAFQYISCYSLSYSDYKLDFLTSVSIHLMLLFIRAATAEFCQKYCFNTSHVTLYPSRQDSNLSLTSCFNTSHITLYRGHGSYSFCRIHVSIHLMLLFIYRKRKELCGNDYVSIHLMLLFILSCSLRATSLVSFQYISCYSLSDYSGGKQGNS